MITHTVFLKVPHHLAPASPSVEAQIRAFEAEGWAVRLWHWVIDGAYIVFERDEYGEYISDGVPVTFKRPHASQ